MGYSLRYEYGIFRQKLVEGWQTELPDFWLPGGEVWMQKGRRKPIEVHFDGYIEEQWHDHYHSVRHKNYNPVMAIRTICMFPAWTARAFLCCASGVRKPTNLI